MTTLRTHAAAAEPRRDQGLYNRVAVLRVERGLSRQELADALGINYQTVGYIERLDYNPSLELAFRMSEFFRLPIEAIFSREPFAPLSDLVYRSAKPDDERSGR
jgi:DNA-binding XRE family transcriptional regulator